MSAQTRTIFLLLIGSIISQTFVAAELVTQSFETDIFKNGHFIKDVDSLTSPGQVYGSCHDKHVEDNVFKARCSFIIETKKSIISKNHLKTCDFALEMKVNRVETNYHIQSITAIDKNKAVLSLQSSNYTKLFVLHFANCQAVPLKMDFQTESVKISAPFDDVFDIYISNEDEYCQYHGLVCKMTVDTRGNVVSEVESWTGIFTELLAVIRSPSKGRIVADVHRTYFEETVARVYAIDVNRDVEILQEYAVDDRDVEPEKYHKVAATSTTYQFMTLCTMLDMNFTCAQFDVNGKLKLESEFNISDDYEIKNFNVHNLPNGGLLLLTQECDKNKPDEYCDDEWNIYVRKFDAVGELQGNVKINGLGRLNVDDMHFFVSDEKNMCLSNVLQHEGGEKVNLIVGCYNDEDFQTDVVEDEV